MAIDQLMGMRVFRAVVEAGSFTGAADKLSLSRGMATRYVAQLEAHLGARLLNRSTRKLSLTGVGTDYYQRAVHVLDLVEEADLSAAQDSRVPRGTLRVTVPAIFGIHQLDHAVVDYVRQYPEVRVEVSVSERVVDLVEEGFDLGVRVANRLDESLVARRLARVPLLACAAPAYLERRGTPAHPLELLQHDCLCYTRSPLGAEWTFRQGAQVHGIRPWGPLCGDNGHVLLNAAEDGLGICFEPRFVVSRALAAGTLRQLLPGWQTEEVSVYAVWPSRKFLHPKVRSFVDFLVGRFAQDAREPQAALP